MIKLNRKIEYALIVLKYMSDKLAGRRTTAKEICDQTKIPFDAASRVMQQMAQKEILRSEHGVHGGYLLIKDLYHLSLLEVIEAVSGPVEVVRCLTNEKECEFFVKCNVMSPLKVFNDKLEVFYRSLMIADLLQIKSQNKINLSEVGGV